MTLSKSDKEFFRQIVEEIVRVEIRKALTVRVLMEQRRDIKTGQPLAVPKTVEKDVYLPEFWVEYLPHYEASMRGVQETTDHVKNQSLKSGEAIATMAKIMLGVKGSLTKLVHIAEALPDKDDVVQIEEFTGKPA